MDAGRLERFMGLVDQDAPCADGMERNCWEWTGAVDRKARPRFFLNERSALAKQALCEILTGTKLPDDSSVVSLCRNRRCVRPEHLFIGNNIDASALGQYGQIDGGYIAMIRAEFSNGYQIDELAVMLEVSVPLIEAILREGGIPTCREGTIL